MTATLKVTIESAWRGGTLDIVTPIVELTLVDHESIPGLKNLGNEYALNLVSGETVMLWCALTPNRQVKFSVTQKKIPIFNLTTEGTFYIEIYLPDGKLYQFQYDGES
ncbi:hypothetical protein [Undibacterium sp. Ren11W]|uniref:hypothetical protein n=1 Tax=Undibacterium sp. Ren11W TaxID=3413045 RepID=UPI003BF1DCC7